MTELFDPPWELPEWRAEAVSWIAERLAERGLRITGPLEQPHIRPWSTVMKLPTERGYFYFKAGGPTQAFEPGLLRILNERRPDDVLPLLAADESRGWSLLPDGGPTFRSVSANVPDIEAWKLILQEYAFLQIASTEWYESLLTVGVVDRPVRSLHSLYDDILHDEEINLVNDDEDRLSEKELSALNAATTVVADMLAELDDFGIPTALEHGDLHDANIFAMNRSYIIFDWGDASFTHPFFSFLIPLRFTADKLGISEHEEAEPLIEMRDAYLNPWLDFASFDKLLMAWALAHHLAKFARTINWYTVAKRTVSARIVERHSWVSGWFKEFLNHPSKRF
jgi:hypothetical protein